MRSESDFHNAIDRAASSIGFSAYGRNLDALFDVLTGIFPRPSRVRWSQADLSRQAFGDRFEKITEVFRNACEEMGDDFTFEMTP